MDDFGSFLVFFLIILAIYLLYLLVVYVILPGIAIISSVTAGTGVLFGGGVTLRNYVRSFRANMFK